MISIPRYDRVLGLPADGRAIALTNSEREDLACPTRWWFRHVERLRGPETAPQRFGTLWHSWMEELHRWWAATDSPFPVDGLHACPFCAGSSADERLGCAICGGTSDGWEIRTGKLIAAHVERAARAEGGSSFTSDDGQDLIEHLGRTIRGWLRRYGAKPYANVKVVGVEVQLARQILHPKTGRPYQPETILVRDDATGSLRFAETGEASGAPLPAGQTLVSVRWPWYQIGKLDAVLLHRAKPVLYVGEFKSSSGPRGLIDDLSLDPQTAGYSWLLHAHAAQFGGSEVVGSMFDVTSSAFHFDPEPLKGRPTKAVPDPPPALSQARNLTVPSWRYEAALAARQIDRKPYEEHLLYLSAAVDPKLYLREWPSLGNETRQRYAEEVYATAARLSSLRRTIARASSVTDLTMAVPRVPICRLPGGGCQFRAPCLLDGENARAKFQIGPAMTWTR